VLLPVYNCAQHARASIDGILEQDYRDFEIIVVDDGSTDGSGEIVRSYRDSRVKVIRNETNLGLPLALNRGAEEATGYYFARQDADDLSSSSRFQSQVEMMDRDSTIGVTGSWWEWMDIYGETYAVSRPSLGTEDLRRILLDGGVPVPHGSMMLRRETYEALGGYDTRFWFSQDYDLWLRLNNTEWQVGIVEKLLYKLRIGPTYTPFKELCQRRYTEIALNQYLSRTRLEFEDVLGQVRTQFPECQQKVQHSEANYWSELGNAALLSLRDRSVSRMYFKRALRVRKSARALAGCFLTFGPLWLASLSVRLWRYAVRGYSFEGCEITARSPFQESAP